MGPWRQRAGPSPTGERRSGDDRPERSRLRAASLLALSGLIALALVSPGQPATAAAAVLWVSPGTNADLTGQQTVEATITASPVPGLGQITEWSIEVLLPGESHPVASRVLCSGKYAGNPQASVKVLFKWDTTKVPPIDETAGSTDCNNKDRVLPASGGQVSANGSHTLLIRVTTSELTGPFTVESPRSVDLNNPPAAPTGVGATFAASSQQMSVAWNLAPEPDVTGYAVDQCRKDAVNQSCGSSDWVRIANPTPRSKTSLTTVLSEPGAYSYRLGAKRPGVNGELVSPWSTASTPVLLAADTSGGTTTTTSPDGAGPDAGSPTNTLPKQADAGSPSGAGGSDGSNGSGGGGDRTRSGPPPRLIDRAEVDAGYEEALPYGARPLDEVGGGGLAEAARGLGLALVPVAGGLILFVFSMQMHYLSRRADGLATATGPVVSHEAPAPRALSDLGAGGSFISNWKRLLDP